MTVRRENICPDCKQSVLWTTIQVDGCAVPVPVAIETCAYGEGNIALQSRLFGAAMEAVEVRTGTGYRRHRDYCPKRPTSWRTPR